MPSLTLDPRFPESNRIDTAPSGPTWLVGESPSMRRVVKHLERASEVQCTVLITGETGTGKEVLARRLHSSGPRAEKPFVPVNCAALTVTLAESQLFGHEKGSFTGAAGSSLGVFRAAQGGVVFLDEIGEMPLELQAKLLRTLQEAEVVPVGSSIPVKIDVQIVAATNRDLQAEVIAGRFREDLFYRLNLVELQIPSLRERAEDIPEFLDFFSRKFAERYHRPLWSPSAETLDAFSRYSWPGNVRQLAHVVEQAYVLEIEPTLPGMKTTEAEVARRLPFLNIDQLRYEAVRQALVLTRGHKGRAAKMLGVHANTLTRMLGEFRITAKDWRTDEK
ncbi:MAG: sigma-54 dependent transcriptional regulator [Pirellulales bacterium]